MEAYVTVHAGKGTFSKTQFLEVLEKNEVDEIDLNNFSSKKCDDLYIAGEVLDIDGTCGGYNLHFAFASAYMIAKNIIKKMGE